MELLISIIGGIIGSNVSAKALKKFNQGGMLNSIIGTLGGAIAFQLLTMLTSERISLVHPEATNIVSLLSSGIAGGCIALIIMSFVKNILVK